LTLAINIFPHAHCKDWGHRFIRCIDDTLLLPGGRRATRHISSQVQRQLSRGLSQYRHNGDGNFGMKNGVLFFARNRALVQRQFSDLPLGAFLIYPLSTRGIYHIKLITRDKVTGCSTSDDVAVRVYENPVPVFIANSAYAREAKTAFNENSTLKRYQRRETSSCANGTSVMTAQHSPKILHLITNGLSIDSLDPAGLYQVALRVTTDQKRLLRHACTCQFVSTPLPITSFYCRCSFRMQHTHS